VSHNPATVTALDELVKRLSPASAREVLDAAMNHWDLSGDDSHRAVYDRECGPTWPPGMPDLVSEQTKLAQAHGRHGWLFCRHSTSTTQLRTMRAINRPTGQLSRRVDLIGR
jgi:hypothetical protein